MGCGHHCGGGASQLFRMSLQDGAYYIRLTYVEHTLAALGELLSS